MLVDEEHGGGSVSGEEWSTRRSSRSSGAGSSSRAPLSRATLSPGLGQVRHDEQRAKVLPDIIGGEGVATWAAAESDGRWEPGAGALRVDGFGVPAVGNQRIGAGRAPGQLATRDGEFGFGLEPAAGPVRCARHRIVPLDGLDISEAILTVRFNEVELGAGDVVGELGFAAEAVDHELRLAAVLSLAESIGAMDQDFSVALDYAKVRTAFGRPIGSFQAIKHMLADTSLLLETSKAVVTAAVEAVQDDAAECRRSGEHGQGLRGRQRHRARPELLPDLRRDRLYVGARPALVPEAAHGRREPLRRAVLAPRAAVAAPRNVRRISMSDTTDLEDIPAAPLAGGWRTTSSRA